LLNEKENLLRTEISSTNRAGCQDGYCKSHGIKILKGELRFGTFVEIQEHQSWRYKHWGCVSGFQIENVRKSMQGSNEVPADGEYRWDFLDGLSDLPEDLQDKIKTAIREGKIADEDFRGVSCSRFCSVKF
jgi:serine/threonine-protein kinase ATR